MELSTSRYRSQRFKALQEEVTSEDIPREGPYIEGARTLADRVTRELAIAIKSSGGLLVPDAARQLPKEEPTHVDSAREALLHADIVAAEVVVVCKASGTQVARVPEAAVLDTLSKQGLRCACGNKIADEQTEQLLTITDRGRLLIDKSRWLSVLVREELVEFGVDPGEIMLECLIGAEEVDCIASVSGETFLLELKDKEFSIGGAYSFGAKIGLVQPDHAAIVTTAHVGNDVKDHFARTRPMERRDRYIPTPQEHDSNLYYIEGLDHLRPVLEEIISAVYRKDSAEILNDVLALASIRSRALLEFIQSPKAETRS